MLDDFLIRALVAGLGFAAIAGPLGCFVVWRRMAYFGEAMAHSALLGLALALLFDLAPVLMLVAFFCLVALLFTGLERRLPYMSDTLLGILAHGGLAAGLVVVAMLHGGGINLMAYLFGDLLAVTRLDVAVILGLAAAGLAGLILFWRPLLLATVSEDLAAAEGQPTMRARIAFVLLLAVVVALGMKVVGMLLIVALLIIPAAAARPLAATPEAMALWAALLGALAVAAGLGGSLSWDLPAGPAIAVAATLIFAATNAAALARGWMPARWRRGGASEESDIR